ncbi:hypothetical protein [Thermocatellispora tengchongensis]|uniref:hypothetical protein n=1 Tax=Thermocatellispora tengchongensis TaxID=1073253 RepID=UPI0036447B31
MGTSQRPTGSVLSRYSQSTRANSGHQVYPTTGTPSRRRRWTRAMPSRSHSARCSGVPALLVSVRKTGRP